MMPAWLRGSALLAVVLAIGIAIGFQFGRHRESEASSPRHAMDSATMMETFDRELSLDPSQHTRIAAVLEQRQAGIDSAWQALKPGVRAAMDSAQMEIDGVLRPNQRARFLTLLRSAHGTNSMPAMQK